MKRVTIIAEVGINHNGDIEIAKQLVNEAIKSGADIVKFQTFNPSKLATRNAPMADYQKKNIGKAESQNDMLSKFALKKEDFIELEKHCKNVGIRFLSTPFDVESIRFLNNLQDVWKIPSGEITNYPYLVEIAKTCKEVFLSTGMSTLLEVDEAVKVLKENGSGEITLLHCTTNYPAQMKDVNLNAMPTLRKHFNCSVGYSDHTSGIEIPIAAVAMGATIIEKHFTLDRNMEGPDHKASIEPDELKAMIDAIRNIEIAIGDGVKKPSASEMPNIKVARKSIVAAKDIKKGEILDETNLTTKRPGIGVSPMRWNDVIGTKAISDFSEDDIIRL